MTEGTVNIQYGSAGLFVMQLESAAGMTSNRVDSAALKQPARLLMSRALMTGAGAAGDTVKIQRNTTDISDAVDISAKVDKAPFDFGTLDDAQMDFGNGDTLGMVTASDGLCRVTCWFMERQATP